MAAVVARKAPPQRRAVRQAPVNALTGMLGTFFDAIFGSQLTRGTRPADGGREILSFCALRVLDKDKTDCWWQEGYRRRDGLLSAAHWAITTMASRGQFFFVPNGFTGNGRQGDWLRESSGKARYRDPKWHFSEENLATLNAVTLDYDEKYASGRTLERYSEDQEAFEADLEQALVSDLGADALAIVKTRDGYGYQPHVLIEPCPATPENIALWKRVSFGVQAMYADRGADPYAAGRPVQPYRPPGSPRPGMPAGWVTRLVRLRLGRRIPLPELAARLDQLGFLPAEKEQSPAITGPRLSPAVFQGNTLMERIEAGAITRGFTQVKHTPSRNWGMFCLSRCLATEGYDHDRIETAVMAVNSVCLPGPLDAAEVRRVAKSAQQYDLPVSQDVWSMVCTTLGVDLAHPIVRAKGGLAGLKRTAEYFREQIRRAGERLDEFMAEQRAWKGAFTQLLVDMGLPAAAGRAVRAAIAERVLTGRLERESRPGRGGYLALVDRNPALITGGGERVGSTNLPDQHCCARGREAQPPESSYAAGAAETPQRLHWRVAANMRRRAVGEISRNMARAADLESRLRGLRRRQRRSGVADGQLTFDGPAPAFIQRDLVAKLEAVREQAVRRVAAAQEAGVLASWAVSGRVRHQLGRWVVELSPVQSATGATALVSIGMAGAAARPVSLRLRLPADSLAIQRALERLAVRVPERWQAWWTQDAGLLVWLVQQVLPKPEGMGKEVKAGPDWPWA